MIIPITFETVPIDPNPDYPELVIEYSPQNSQSFEDSEIISIQFFAIKCLKITHVGRINAILTRMF